MTGFPFASPRSNVLRCSHLMGYVTINCARSPPITLSTTAASVQSPQISSLSASCHIWPISRPISPAAPARSCWRRGLPLCPASHSPATAPAPPHRCSICFRASTSMPYAKGLSASQVTGIPTLHAPVAPVWRELPAVPVHPLTIPGWPGVHLPHTLCRRQATGG